MPETPVDVIQFRKLYEKYVSDPESLTEDEVKNVQTYLKDKGHDIDVDGVVGDNTTGALGSYIQEGFVDDYSNEALRTGEDGAYANPDMAMEIAGMRGISEGKMPEGIDLNAFPEDYDFQQHGLSRTTVGDDTFLFNPEERVQSDLKQGIATKRAAEADQAELAQAETQAREELQDDVGKKQADVYNVAQGALDLGNLVQAGQQIKAGKEQAKEKRPQMPEQRPDEGLREMTRQAQAAAQTGLSDRVRGGLASRDLASYANALRAARTAGAGNASLVGAQAQGLHRNVLDRNIDMAVADQQAQQDKFGQAAAMTGQRAAERAQMARNQLEYGYKPELEDWRGRMAEARQTEQVGRLNLARQLSTMPYKLGNLTRDYYREGEQSGRIPLEGTPERAAYDENIAGKKLQRKENRRELFNRLNPANALRKFKKSKPEMMDFQTGPEKNYNPYTPYYGGVENTATV